MRVEPTNVKWANARKAIVDRQLRASVTRTFASRACRYSANGITMHSTHQRGAQTTGTVYRCVAIAQIARLHNALRRRRRCSIIVKHGRVLETKTGRTSTNVKKNINESRLHSQRTNSLRSHAIVPKRKSSNRQHARRVRMFPLCRVRIARSCRT